MNADPRRLAARDGSSIAVADRWSAAMLRFWAFGRLGLTHFDEGIYAFAGLWIVCAERALRDSTRRSIAYAPPGFPILVGLAYLAFGVSRRLGDPRRRSSAASLTIPVVGWLGRRTFGPGAGAAAAAFAALSMVARRVLAEGPDRRPVPARLARRASAWGAVPRAARARPGARARARGRAGPELQVQRLARRGDRDRRGARRAARRSRRARRAERCSATFGWGLLAAVDRARSSTRPGIASSRPTAATPRCCGTIASYLGGVVLVVGHLAHRSSARRSPSRAGDPGGSCAWVLAWLAGALGDASAGSIAASAAGRSGLARDGSARRAVLASCRPTSRGGSGSPGRPGCSRPIARPSRMLGAWWLVLSVLTPFYHPYARLWLPLHADRLAHARRGSFATIVRASRRTCGERRAIRRVGDRRRARRRACWLACVLGRDPGRAAAPLAMPWSRSSSPRPSDLRGGSHPRRSRGRSPDDGTRDPTLRAAGRSPSTSASSGRYPIQLEPSVDRLLAARTTGRLGARRRRP